MWLVVFFLLFQNNPIIYFHVILYKYINIIYLKVYISYKWEFFFFLQWVETMYVQKFLEVKC